MDEFNPARWTADDADRVREAAAVEDHLHHLEAFARLLSPRQRELMYLLVMGLPKARAARVLGVKPKTVQCYLLRILRKSRVTPLPKNFYSLLQKHLAFR